MTTLSLSHISSFACLVRTLPKQRIVGTFQAPVTANACAPTCQGQNNTTPDWVLSLEKRSERTNVVREAFLGIPNWLSTAAGRAASSTGETSRRPRGTTWETTELSVVWKEEPFRAFTAFDTPSAAAYQSMTGSRHVRFCSHFYVSRAAPLPFSERQLGLKFRPEDIHKVVVSIRS